MKVPKVDIIQSGSYKVSSFKRYSSIGHTPDERGNFIQILLVSMAVVGNPDSLYS
jgi:hypothetical protein